MPITISLELGDHGQTERNDRTRISLAFARLCWESTGPSSWRYPAVTSGEPPAEDWLNHVVPALMYLRCLLLGKGIPVIKYTLDAHSHSVFRGKGDSRHGTPVLPAEEITQCPPADYGATKQLSEARMNKFLDDCVRCTVSRKPGGEMNAG